ncbi:helix-turn-helix domain-containing protein [Paucibacter sp. R3-3]|uniref:Helix-turn-helix domain-containing protein n=1 Tax=Roseateles agri TaxID=3098619 RepID=A0ABU5DQJ3_9BURK|nr:helix-turn-helix domain-containing protein [Paucibacter sp. R3-3]MDY0748594.1 helix-turn-helix domain-containing protein [Paucibacter sp. R3-3]
MGRWEADAAGRFRAAAMELFGEIGYEQTTVAAIAARAGLTARTFFRHFADKREVLFDGSARLQQLMVASVSGTPAEASPLDAVAAALLKSGEFFDDERRPFARLRNHIIAAHPDLHERELIKLATLSAALTAALRERGVDEPDASLVAETGIAVFRIAFAQWVAESETRGYAEIVNQSLARLKALAAH